MNGVISIPLENIFLTLPKKSRHFSDSEVEKIDEIADQEKIIMDEFKLLEESVGQELFKQLSYEQKMFLINVSGTIDLGKSVDIEKIYDSIENLEYE